MIISQNITDLEIICQICWSKSIGVGPHKHFMKKCIFWQIFWYFVIFHHTISIVWTKCPFHSEMPSLIFWKWGHFWFDHVYLSIYHKKREDSCSKKLYFWCKMILFFSLFFLQSLCSAIPRDLYQDIWHKIFELVVFHKIIIGNPQTPANFDLKGGTKLLITPYIMMLQNFLFFWCFL